MHTAPVGREPLKKRPRTQGAAVLARLERGRIVVMPSRSKPVSSPVPGTPMPARGSRRSAAPPLVPNTPRNLAVRLLDLDYF